MTKFAQKSFPQDSLLSIVPNLCVDDCGGEKELI